MTFDSDSINGFGLGFDFDFALEDARYAPMEEVKAWLRVSHDWHLIHFADLIVQISKKL